MCNRHRIITARDQYAMLAPWRTAEFYTADELRQIGGYAPNPDLEETQRVHGSRHTTGGRVLPQRTAVADQATQAARLADPTGWAHHVSFTPSGLAVAGARAYSGLRGLPDPHQQGYEHIRADPKAVAATGRHYDSLPDLDRSALPHYQAMGDEVNKQHDFMTNRLGIKTQSVDYDPYKDVHEMVHDVNNNKTLKVMGTHVTGGHPFFSDQDNDKFRAVHDFFGHAATGRSFDRHGEQAAYLAHSQMFSPHAIPALASETKGQNSSLILNGHFPPQKLATMNPAHYADGLNLHLPKTAATPDFGEDWQGGVMKDVDETGGFSRRGPQRPPDKGFMVALPGSEEIAPSAEVGGEQIADYGRRHWPKMEEDEETYQGGWKSPPDFFHDVSRRHPDLWDAAQAGYGENEEDAQHGVYDLNTRTTFSPLELIRNGEPGITVAKKKEVEDWLLWT